MRIAFLDPIPWDYRIESPYQMPLGDSQFALCYLAEALAQQGHEVFLLNGTTVSGWSRGAQCLSLRQSVPLPRCHALDAFIVLNAADLGPTLRPQLVKALAHPRRSKATCRGEAGPAVPQRGISGEGDELRG